MQRGSPTPTPDSIVGSAPSDPSAPHFYNPNAVLSLPVTIPQITRFRPQDAPPPVLVLADGSYYYGDVDVPGRIGTGAVPHGVGIMLFKAASLAGAAAPVASREALAPPTTTTTTTTTAQQTTSSVNPSLGGGSGTLGAPSTESRSADTARGATPLTIPAPSKSGNFNLEQTCLAFESGDRYGGSWSFGLFEGNGVLVTSTFTYQGNWSAGKMHGKGHMQYNKNFVDRMPGGAGAFDGGGVGALLWRGLSMLSPFEDSAHKPKEYIGDFDRAQLRHGHGLLRYVNGDVYEGQWRSNRRNGKGTLTQADGEVYEGEWDNDIRQGYGTINYPDGKKFKGHLLRGVRDGEGVLVYANGDEYYGQFSRDKMQGQGTMRYKNGDLYEGEWKDGMRNGKGKYTLKKKKSIVEGVFVNGLIHGAGTVENPGISLFVGSFVRGERSEGTMFFFHGAPGALQHVACYQGEWASERIQGKGLMWLRNGDFYYGTFDHNERSGQGNMRYARDGSEYSGSFARNRREGWGIWQRTDGFIKAGRWVADRFMEGYEGEWDGAQLNGVGHLRLSFETFLFGPKTIEQASEQAKKKNKKSSRSPATRSPTSPNADTTAMTVPTTGLEGTDASSGAIAAGEAVEFFGLFCHGHRDGPGVLRVPAVLSELFPALPVPSFRRALPMATPASGLPARRRFFFSSAAAKKSEAAAAEASAEVARRRQRACGVADGVEVGDDAQPVCPARHVIKGSWRGGLLECESGVWAFPSGEVYLGPFHGGQRGINNNNNSSRCATMSAASGAPSITWCADGSVHVGTWCNDAPTGEGLFFAKNRRDPKIWTEMAPTTTTTTPTAASRAPAEVDHDEAEEEEEEESLADGSAESRRRRAAERVSQSRRQASLRAAAGASPPHKQPPSSTEAPSSVAATAEPRAVGLDAALNFFAQASSAEAMLPATAAQESHSVTTTTTTTAAVAAPTHEALAEPRRRVLTGYGEHFLVHGHWASSAVPEMSYFYGLQPPLFAGPRPVDVNPYSTVMDALGYLPEAALRRHAAKMDDPSGAAPASSSSSSSPLPHAASNRTLSLPATVPVGRVEDRHACVWFYGSGVCLASSYRGNNVRLAMPHRPASLFDVQYVQDLQRCGVLPAGYRAPAQQSNMTAWLTWHAAAVKAAEKERHKQHVEETLHAALLSDTDGRAAERRPTIKPMDAETRALLEAGPPEIAPATSSVPQCVFCGKEFGMFRRAVSCTLCFRVACSACLGNLELTSASDGSGGKSTTASAGATSTSSATYATTSVAAVSAVHAAALEAYALQQAALTTSAQWKKEKPETLARVLDDIPSTLEAYRDELTARGVTSVPTCVDCVRALLLKIQVHTLWIPSALFPNASVAATCWSNESPTDPYQSHNNNNNSSSGEAKDVVGNLVEAEESQRRAAESLEASLPSHTSTPSVQDGGAEASHATETESVALSAPSPTMATTTTTTTTADVSPMPQAPRSADKDNDDADVAHPLSGSTSPSSAASAPRAPPTFYVVYSGYTTGQMIPHVYGELWWGQRAYYRGGFADGQRDGFGTQIFCASGEKYVGEFRRDMWHGFGLFFYADGSVLQGLFCRNRLVHTLYRGEVDEQWRRHGRGVAYDLEADGVSQDTRPSTNNNNNNNNNSCGDGDAVSCGVQDCVAHLTARGLTSSAMRTSYNGEWVHGERHGTGIYQCFPRPDRDREATATTGAANNTTSASDTSHAASTPVVYSGTFSHDAIDGVGKLVTADGAYYGQFVGNEKQGKGVAFLSDMAIEGHWSEGVLDGFCRLFSSDKETIYETTFSLGNERDDCFPPPLMVDDGESDACVQCSAPFSMFTRRHHCRLCGKLFCDACSQKRAQLPAHFKISGQAQQRVCDGCFDRLGQRRCLALCRYRDGSVYAGCWSQGRWVSRGLYCRADGLFFLFTSNGTLIPGETGEGPTSELAASVAPAKSPATRRGPAPPLCDEIAFTREQLAALTVSSPLTELDKFIMWWASAVTRCQLHVALDIPMLQRLQALRRTEPSLTPAPNALVKGVRPQSCLVAGTALAAQLSAVSVREALRVPKATRGESEGRAVTVEEGTTPRSASFFLYPTPPALPVILLFVPFQHFVEAERARHAAQSHGDDSGSRSRQAVTDEATHAAARRASLFTPAVAPAMPAYPPPPPSPRVTSTDAGQGDVAGVSLARPLFSLVPPTDTTTNTSTMPAAAPVRVVLPSPPTFAAHDVRDETVLKQIAEARVHRFLAFAPPSATPDAAHGVGNTHAKMGTAAAEAHAAGALSRPMPLLTCYSHKPLVKATPLPPESGTNVKVAWDDFSTHSAAALVETATQHMSSASGTTTTATPTAFAENPDMAVLFACPFLPPAIPDVQQTLEVGKIRQVTALLTREAVAATTDTNTTDAADEDDGRFSLDSNAIDDDDGADGDGDRNFVRAAWRTRYNTFLNTVPGAAGPARAQLQREVGASPFAAFFVRSFETHLFSSSDTTTAGAAAAAALAAKKASKKTAKEGRKAVSGAEGDAGVEAALALRADMVGWLPGRLRGPLDNSMSD